MQSLNALVGDDNVKNIGMNTIKGAKHEVVAMAIACQESVVTCFSHDAASDHAIAMALEFSDCLFWRFSRGGHGCGIAFSQWP